MKETQEARIRKPYVVSKQRQLWSDHEHELFVEALRLHNRNWRKIEAHVGTKTAVQIRSHAQKHFQKLEKCGEGSSIPPPRSKRQAHSAKPMSAAYSTKRQATGAILNQATQPGAADTVMPLLRVAALATLTPAGSRQGDSAATTSSGSSSGDQCSSHSKQPGRPARRSCRSSTAALLAAEEAEERVDASGAEMDALGNHHDGSTLKQPPSAQHRFDAAPIEPADKQQEQMHRKEPQVQIRQATFQLLSALPAEPMLSTPLGAGAMGTGLGVTGQFGMSDVSNRQSTAMATAPGGMHDAREVLQLPPPMFAPEFDAFAAGQQAFMQACNSGCSPTWQDYCGASAGWVQGWPHQLPPQLPHQPQHVAHQPDATSETIDFKSMYAYLGSLFDSRCENMDHRAMLSHLNPPTRHTAMQCLQTLLANMGASGWIDHQRKSSEAAGYL